MSQTLTALKIGTNVKIKLDRLRDRIPSSLIDQIKKDPRGRIVDYKMTDGGVGVVLELRNGQTSWFFDNEITRG